MAGKRDANLRAGDLAEGFGRELFRRFCAVAPVPREEDVGVDAMCTLFRRENSRALYAENSFGVQFKTTSIREILYSEHEADWLRLLDIPLLIASVDLERATLELYSTENVHARYVHSGAPFNNILLCLDAPGREPKAGQCGLYDLGRDDESKATKYWLGTPLVRFSMLDAADSEFPRHAYARIKPWLDFSTESRRLRRYGVYREVSLDGSQPPEAMSFDTADQGGDVIRLLAAINPLLWRLSSLLGHVFNEGPLLAELRAIREYMRQQHIEPIGLWEDTGPRPAPPVDQQPEGSPGRTLINWVGAPTANGNSDDPQG